MNEGGMRSSADGIGDRSIWLVSAALFSFIFVQRLTSVLAYYLGLYSKFGSPADGETIVGTVCTYVFGAGVCALLMSLADKSPVKRRDIGAPAFFEALFISFALMFIGNIAGIALTTVFGGDTMLIDRSFSGNIAVTAVSVALAAPVVEELIFRRMLIPRLMRFGERTAVLFSALAFAVMHGNFLQFFYAFGFGILCGYVFVRTGNVLYTIALHMTINTAGGVVSTAVEQAGSGTLKNVYTAITVAAAAVGVFLLCRRAPTLRLSSPPPGSEAGKAKLKLFFNPFMLAYSALCAALFVLSL